MAKKKILIIAGGGVFGCIPAHFLSFLPEKEQNLNKIDMISGCSIGGILAAGYAAGRDFTTVDNIFQARAADCFDKRFLAKLYSWSCPTYDNDSLDNVLKDILGEMKLGEVRKTYPNLDVIIPSLDITEDYYKVFDNIEGHDDDVLLTTIAGLTSAAPTYYSGRDFQGHCHIDGGLIEVAPLFTATTAMRARRGIPFEDMDVLMIGTGKAAKEEAITTKIYNRYTILGVANNVIAPYATLGNEMATAYWGKNMGYHHFEYFNPCAIHGDLDDIDMIDPALNECDRYKNEFLTAWYDFMNA